MRNLNNYRKQILFFFDTFVTICACVFIFGILPNNIFRVDNIFLHCILIVVSVSITRLLFRVYVSIWRYAETGEYILLMAAEVAGCVIGFAAEYLIFRERIPIIYLVAVYMLSLLAVLCSRFVYRKIIKELHIKQRKRPSVTDGPSKSPNVYVAIIGAGYAGTFLVDEMKSSGKYIPYCFFDDDKAKIGKVIHGIPVKGKVEDIPEILKGTPVTQILIAIPSITGEALEEILKVCSLTGCITKLYEYPMDRIEDRTSLKTRFRDVKIEDLLSREQVNLNTDNLKSFISDRTVLVTGGGGSIGSELCRQIARFSPARLIILDIYENNAYEIQQELQAAHPELLLDIEIASVREAEKVDRIFEKYRPDLIFHAAAHKHVPLMENNPDEAIKNNIFGTYNVVKAAEKYGVKKMVMISTDKAVNPTNVMGATKRVCEMIIQSMRHSTTEYVAVRFGNVLGSNGSVIPLFKKQIEKGGPVTITDKRIIRYFMTIPEAAQLVLQAGVMAAKSEIFVLDMGAPVKIYDLAKNMITLSGLIPDVDIKIEEIGLRPGEKLYEELLVNKETMTRTGNEKIFIEHTTDEEFLTREEMEERLIILKEALKSGDSKVIVNAIRKIVPTFKAPEDVNGKFFEIKEEAGETDRKVDSLPEAGGRIRGIGFPVK